MELPRNFDARSVGLLVFRLAAGQLVVTYLKKWFLLKWLILAIAVLLLVTRHWIWGSLVLGLAALTFLVAFVVVRFAQRWSVPKKLRPIRSQLATVKEAGIGNVRAELAGAGVPVTLFGLFVLLCRLAGSGRRQVPGELVSSIGRVDLTRIFPRSEIDELGKVLQQAWGESALRTKQAGTAAGGT